MDIKHVIVSFLLSFIFLFFFTYIIFGRQLVSENFFQGKNQEIFLADLSIGLQDSVIENKSENIFFPDINVKSVISVESNLKDFNKIIFEKDSNIQLPIASLTKLMTAIVVLDNYKLSDVLEIDKVAELYYSQTKQNLKVGDEMKVENLLDMILIESNNKAAYTLSELMGENKFVHLMNQKAENLGMQNTFFVEPTGLSAKNISTASDLVILAQHILKSYPKIANISKIKELYIPDLGIIENTNQLLKEFPDIICSKTGFTTIAKGCLLLVLTNPSNQNYIINIILGADDRFSEMKKLINWSNVVYN